MTDSSALEGLLVPGAAFTVAELYAMALDGVLAAVFGHAFRPVEVPESPALRAAALAHHAPAALAGRAAIGGLAAAWIHGCAPPPRVPIALLVPSGHRTTALPANSGCVLHEVRLDPYDVERLGGALVTNGLRTARDVAMYAPEQEARAVLAAIAATPALACPLGRIRAAIAVASHVPGKRRAQALLDAMIA